MDAHKPLFVRVYGKISIRDCCMHQIKGLCALPFAIHASHVMIILPYTRIAWYRNAASTVDTEGGRAQRSAGSISMVKTQLFTHQFCI